ncbi:S8 family serine peptidase [Isoptericola hypogeus]|uniref:S8 family serine peptidase n=1 Tax=Isoptericola hypogeus TaxID=300179 RepID=UPI0031D550B8
MTVLVVAISLVAPGAASTATAGPADPGPARPSTTDVGPAEIRPGLAKKLEARGVADFWVRFDATADLSQARRIQDWDERGAAVVEALRRTAETSQRGVLKELDAAGVDHEAFWATNAVFVENGSEELADSLAGYAAVDSLWPTQSYGPVEPVAQADPSSPQAVEWGISNIHADDVWAQLGVDGDDVVIANIDTGVQYDHPALVDQYRGNNGDGTFSHDYNWLDTADRCSGDAPCDANGHGTHTMGTMLGSDGGDNKIGVAPGATWITANGCRTCSREDTMEAAQWMLAPTRLDGTDPDPAKRPNIINNSWGTTVPSTDPFMDDVAAAWAGAGIFGVWSNGNNGPVCNTSGAPGSRTSNYSVGAYDVNNTVAGFSSRGSGQDGGIKPDISAPGVNVRSAVPGSGYASYNGTSMAAPHVAGAIALLWSAQPELVGDIEETRVLLDSTAVDTADAQCGGTAADNNVYGEGRLDALAMAQIGAKPAGVLSGAVTDASGAPIGHASVHVTGGQADTPVDRTVAVSADGVYDLRLPVGDYEVTASAFGFETRAVTVTVTQGETVSQDLSLTAAASETVTGQVSDASGHGWPMRARISVSGHPEIETYSDPHSGKYELSLPEGAAYTLEATSADLPGYADAEFPADLTGGEAITADIGLSVDEETCTAPGYEFAYDGAHAEFEGWTDSPLDGWTVEQNEGNPRTWEFDNPDRQPNRTGGSGNFAVVVYAKTTGENYTSLVSPVTDLSENNDPTIDFDTDFVGLGDQKGTVDLSLDGGQTWNTIWASPEDAEFQGHVQIPIPRAANQSQVKVRFHLGWATYGWWWQVDDVIVGTRTCEQTSGGLVAGVVRDHNTGDPVDGVTITAESATAAHPTSAPTPEDENLSDGYYWLFVPTGTERLTATYGNYTPAGAEVDVTADGVHRQDFDLRAGHLTIDTTSLDFSLKADAEATQKVTLRNDGTEPVRVRLDESAVGEPTSAAAPAGTPEAPEMKVRTATTVAGTAVEQPAAGHDAMVDERFRSSADDTAWAAIADYPQAAMDAASAWHDGKLYVAGGSSGYTKFAGLKVYDPAAGTWSALASLPEPLSGAAAQFVGDTLYVAGGWNAAAQSSAHTYAYDPGENTWTRVADLPRGLSAAGSAVLDGTLYVVGGCTTNECDSPSDAVHAYDPHSDTWSGAPAYPTPVAFTACGGLGGQLVCAGGVDATTDTALAATYVFVPGLGSWKRQADLPATTWGASSAAANGQLQVVGGVIDGGHVTNLSYTYDPAADAWSPLPNARTAAYRGTASCGLYRIGGATGGFRAVSLGETLPGYDLCEDAPEASWLSVTPTEITLAPGKHVKVRVTADAGKRIASGDYTAAVAVATDTPCPNQSVKVTLRVRQP